VNDFRCPACGFYRDTPNHELGCRATLHRCPICGDLVCQRPIPGEQDGIVCGGPLGHIVIERKP